MAKVSIQKTIFVSHRVEMIVGDAREFEAAKTWLHLSVPTDWPINRPVAEAQLNALQHAHAAIAAEIQVLKSLEGRKS
jgi:hypothetical protein